MAVRDRAFRRWRGASTPRRGRFLVLWRHGRREVFSSKLVTAFYALSFAPILVAATIVYLRHNVPAMEALELEIDDLIAIDAGFFVALLRAQGAIAFVLTALVGPGLVSPDLANQGLPLYLSRPFSRTEYVLGKMSVLVFLTSSITWVPLLALFALQGALEPGWVPAHWGLAGATFLGSVVWIVFLALLALALSAWVRWRFLAAALLVALVFVAGGFAEFVNQMFSTDWGDLLSPGKLILIIWEGLFGGVDPMIMPELPQWSAWAAIALYCLVCLGILNRKLRAYEVVR